MIVRRELDAAPSAVDEVLELVDGLTAGLGETVAFDLRLACEEIFVNIVSYAYPGGTGRASLTWEHDPVARRVTVTFEDSGIPFNPLDQPAPDLGVPIAEREIGGLGIVMARQRVDEMRYERAHGRNVLTLVKECRA
ncbi:putative anti-sigma regulatory factor, serine/threonine protein kinase [Xylanimonas cellulosilytica DSM 15894]|uniref:Anti-sigma regulatory factor, serine/threonine protein kinase n=1 Tax=Xylanimonas cellulosilytica (strain DSM 15894 / JCM 12276 / CECT 5975 / KCTC 9989 / LMG 20990 / NBRC 107835 / XIL07) TaxID=446471 RepID=D1BYJ8_XYLCX|nr:ATP-binding protein [Xylanimonas cellulosilytica]ACZ31870.1 putative anti-sigma regulatory factor, serine/threonine protein kinase [Xylanimonas cellulosilytica DSM 15894]